MELLDFGPTILYQVQQRIEKLKRSTIIPDSTSTPHVTMESPRLWVCQSCLLHRHLCVSVEHRNYPPAAEFAQRLKPMHTGPREEGTCGTLTMRRRGIHCSVVSK